MYNLSQKELLEEKLWDSFKNLSTKIANSKIGRLTKQVGTGALEVAKLAAPETTSKLNAARQKAGEIAQKISDAGKTMEEKVLRYLATRNLMPLPNKKIELVETFANGDTKWSTEVGRMGYDPASPKKPIIIQNFTYPQVIIYHEKKNNSFKLLLEPAMRRYGAV